MRHLLFIAAAVSLTLIASVGAQDTKHDEVENCSVHAQKETQDAHHADVNKHGDLAMGFPHDKTTHHFRLRSDGGAIEITANDSNDKTNTASNPRPSFARCRIVRSRRLLDPDVHPRHNPARDRYHAAAEGRNSLSL